MPDQSSESTLSQLKGKTLTGWEEIRQALVVVDRLPEEECNGFRVEVYEYSKGFSLKANSKSEVYSLLLLIELINLASLC